MKKFLPLFVLLPMLWSCTETIYDEVIKEIRDTIRIKGDSVPYFIDRIRIDSVPYPVFVNDTIFVPTIVRTVQIDTVYLPGETVTDIDTVFIEKIVETIVYDTIINTVYVYDTLIIREHHYHDTLYIFPGRSVYNVGIYSDIVNQFYADAHAYGRQMNGGNLLISPWEQSEAPPDNRSSFSYYTWSQFILKVRDDITPDEAYTPIYRELARMQLNKSYTKAADDFMNPEFDWERVTYSSSDAEKKPFLDKLFSKEPI